jgi:sugar (pentulose or hexulose) kinase
MQESDAVTGACDGLGVGGRPGCPKGCPWFAGGGDAVLQTTCTGLVSSDVLGVVIGTSGVVATGISGARRIKTAICSFSATMRPAFGTPWHYAGGGRFVQMGSAIACQAEKRRRSARDRVYDLLNAQAQSARWAATA